MDYKNDSDNNYIKTNQIIKRVAVDYNTAQLNNAIPLLLQNLDEIYDNVLNQYTKKYATNRLIEINKGKKHIIKKEMKRETKKKDDKIKIFRMMDIKYDLKNVILKDRYKNKYENFIKNNIMSYDLYHSGFYEYLFKLKQHLSECGLNRTQQLYGTCWFNVAINGIIFGSKMRGRMIQLLLYYKQIISDKEFNNMINDVNKNKYKLNLNIERNENNIFDHIVAILYKTLCQEGLRNKDPKKYENFSLTNLAINIKNLASNDTKKKKEHIKDIPYDPIYGLNILTHIFNKFIDDKPHLMWFKYSYGIHYELNNLYHINILYFSDTGDKQYFYAGQEYGINFKNIIININNNGIKKEYKSNNDKDEIFKNIDNIDFICYIPSIDTNKIPIEFNCIVDNQNQLFKLDYAIIGISYVGIKMKHVITGLICNNNYYVYDSFDDIYFECNWTDLSNPTNYQKIVNYYQIVAAKHILNTYDIPNTSGKFFDLYNKSSIPKIIFDYRYVIYYNNSIKFSYDHNSCLPKRI